MTLKSVLRFIRDSILYSVLPEIHPKIEEKIAPKSKKAIVIGTGPSLNDFDFTQPKYQDYDLIAVNGYVKLAAEKKVPEPDVVVLQDIETARRLVDSASSLKDAKFVISNLVAKNVKFFKQRADFIFRHDMLSHYESHLNSKLKTKISKNFNQKVFDGYTVIYSALQLSYHLNYHEVILVGVDAHYDADINKRNVVDIGKIDQSYHLAGERIRYAVEFFAEAQVKVKIYKASSISALNIPIK